MLASEIYMWEFVRSRIAPLAVVSCLGLALGCSGDSGPKLDPSVQATITGSVTNDGKALPVDCSVYFSSKETGTTAAGKLDSLGNFSATPPNPKQGLSAGRYAVMVRPPAVEQVAPSPTDPKYKEFMMNAGKPKAQASDVGIPKSFLTLETTKLILEVKPGPNNFVIDLAKIK